MINRLPFGRGVSTRQLHQNYLWTRRRRSCFYLSIYRKNGRLRELATVYTRFVIIMFVFVCAAYWTHFLFRSHPYNSTLKRLCKYSYKSVFYNNFFCGKLSKYKMKNSGIIKIQTIKIVLKNNNKTTNLCTKIQSRRRTSTRIFCNFHGLNLDSLIKLRPALACKYCSRRMTK